MSARLLIGDVREVLRTLPDASVDLVLTSPPFLALRSYLPADHPDKALEMGSEPTPGEFIDALLDVVEECGRVLAPHGSICFELGDTYAGSGGGGGDYLDGGMREGQQQFAGSASTMRESNAEHWRQKNADRDAWPLDKSLCLIPEIFRFALVYGFNPLTGRETPRWRARNVVRWARPNPPVGALADKFRPATSDMVIACVDRKRYFDLDAVRGAPSENTHARTAKGVASKGWSGKSADRDGNWSSLPELAETAGAPPLDHWWHDDTFDQDAWNIPTHGYPGSHYATWPPALLTKPILAMCPQRVCTICGEPSERVVGAYTLDSYRASGRPQTVKAVTMADAAGLTDEHIAAIRSFGTSDAGKAVVLNSGAGKNSERVKKLAAEAKAVLGGYFREFVQTATAAPGSTWSDCGHDSWRPGVVLDPFAGSGTTLAVATGHGRDAIGIDLDERNADLCRERVGMFLAVEDTRTQEGAA